MSRTELLSRVRLRPPVLIEWLNMTFTNPRVVMESILAANTIELLANIYALEIIVSLFFYGA